MVTLRRVSAAFFATHLSQLECAWVNLGLKMFAMKLYSWFHQLHEAAVMLHPKYP